MCRRRILAGNRNKNYCVCIKLYDSHTITFLHKCAAATTCMLNIVDVNVVQLVQDKKIIF